MIYVFKMFLLLFIVVLILPEREASRFIYLNATHPDHVGKCYVPGPPPKIINVGESKRDSKMCVELSCYEGFSVIGTGCGLHAVDVHCHTIPGDPSKPFPHCCPEVIC